MNYDLNMPLSDLVAKLLKGEADELHEEDLHAYMDNLTHGDKKGLQQALKEVEKSNTHLVENMEQVSGVVETMTDRISHSDETTKTMLSKYTETVLNIDSIEHVVENLMTELGIGGFMGVEDL